MNTSRAFLAVTLSVAAFACGVETEPPPIVGDVGDTSGSELKVACNLSREQIMAGASGGRATAIERGFSWYDQQVAYSQSSQHEGYRTDCSGFVSMCWELGQSYTTANFINDTGEWTSLGSFSELQPADAMVYRSGGSGHIVMFLGWNDSAQTQACVLEQASTAEDMQFRARTIDSLQASGYHAIRATKFGAGGAADDPNTGSGGSSGGQCYCDAECSNYGDCCSSCGTGTGGSPGSGGSPSGSGGSSGSGGQCYCDASCADYGDCCAGCGTGSGGSGAGSGSGGSSGGSGQCYCDAQCDQYGDCCPGCGSGSGSGSGGSGSGQCYCDAQCAEYGDCCSDCP